MLEAGRIRADKESRCSRKIAALRLSSRYTEGLLDIVFSRLERQNFFYNPVEIEIERNFMPCLAEQVYAKTQEAVLARRITGGKSCDR